MAFLVALGNCKVHFIRAQYHYAQCLPWLNAFLAVRKIVSLLDLRKKSIFTCRFHAISTVIISLYSLSSSSPVVNSCQGTYSI